MGSGSLAALSVLEVRGVQYSKAQDGRLFRDPIYIVQCGTTEGLQVDRMNGKAVRHLNLHGTPPKDVGCPTHVTQRAGVELLDYTDDAKLRGTT